MTRAAPKKSPENVEKHLKNANYPATKQDLLRVAKSNDAPEDVLSSIRDLPKDRFEGPKDVKKTYERAFSQTGT